MLYQICLKMSTKLNSIETAECGENIEQLVATIYQRMQFNNCWHKKKQEVRKIHHRKIKHNILLIFENKGILGVLKFESSFLHSGNDF